MSPIQLNPYFAKWVGRIKLRTSITRARVLILYATVSGNSKQLAMRVRCPNLALRFLSYKPAQCQHPVVRLHSTNAVKQSPC